MSKISHHDTWTIIENCEELMSTGNGWLQMIVCAWMERLGDRLDRSHFFHFERWLYLYVQGWSGCDDFCKRITNPLLRKYPDLFDRIAENWTTAQSIWVRRASAVSLIRSEGGGHISDIELEKILNLSNRLIRDDEVYVQKGVGWLLKSASLCHRDGIVRYLEAHRKNMSRLSFRYALEKLDRATRNRLMESAK